jgi:hypothetical protein
MEKQISIIASEDCSIILANTTINCSIKSNNEGTLIVPCDFMSEIILNDLVDNSFLEPVIIRDVQMYKTTDNEVIIW